LLSRDMLLRHIHIAVAAKMQTTGLLHTLAQAKEQQK
jgi:hypothetical protein